MPGTATTPTITPPPEATDDVAYVGAHTRMTVSDWIMLGWTRTEAGSYAAEGHHAAKVLRVTPDGTEPLHHVVRHSPTGFGWGYAGSGPAELALAIVCDRLGLRGAGGTYSPMLVTADDRCVLPEPPYQRFKADRIARLPQGESWIIQAAEVDAWLAASGYDLEAALVEVEVEG